ncbi:MAG TPA: hypothetical protein VJ161_12110 [Geobacteraceae bacterium]|jgi:formate dehydrogenase major subunit|nr:hypothetical protein [Geobacteraceae bacterium]
MPEVIAKFDKAWGVKLSNKPGLTVTEIVGKVGKGEIKVLYIMGENPTKVCAVSIEPFDRVSDYV